MCRDSFLSHTKQQELKPYSTTEETKESTVTFAQADKLVSS